MKLSFLRSTLSVAALAATALLGGCMSSERMARISPLSETEGPKMSEKRTNAWPLYYSAGTGVSVLWPLMDFDDAGWAFRPFYASDNDDRAILWPLSGWDADSGWALNSYWNKDDYFGAWPLFHWNTSDNKNGKNYIIPFWWTNDGEDWGLFPLFGVGNDDWRFLNFYKGKDEWNFWPLAYREKTYNGGDEWRLLYGLLGGGNITAGEAWLVPLFYHDDDFTWAFPTFFRTKSWNTLLPFYYYRSLGEDYTLITPLGGIGTYTDGGHLYNFLGPVYIDYENPSENYTYQSFLWPLYIRSRDGDSTFAYTFPFGSKWTNGGESGRSFLLGLGATRTKNDETSWAFWPLHGNSKNYSTSDFRFWLTLSGSISEGSDEDTWNTHWLFPLYHYEGEKNYDEYQFLCYLTGWRERVSSSDPDFSYFSSYLFPLWFYDSRGSEKRRDRDFFIPLIYGFEHDWHDIADKKSWEHWALLNLFNFEKDYYTAIPKVKNTRYQSLREKSCYRFINTFWETREFACWKDSVLTQREQEIIDYAMRIIFYFSSYDLKITHIPPFGGIVKLPELNIDSDYFDKEIFGTDEVQGNSWEEWDKIAMQRKAFAKKELTELLRKRGIEISEENSALSIRTEDILRKAAPHNTTVGEKALLDALQNFARENSESFTEKEFQVWPFYESIDDAFGSYEKELLWGVWYSRGNDEEYFTSCLKYLYRHERTKAGSKLDIFPFISIDTGKRGAFSFLGNFFKIVNDDDEGWSGNFLFIPWGK